MRPYTDASHIHGRTQVSEKMAQAMLENIRVARRDAFMRTNNANESGDKAWKVVSSACGQYLHFCTSTGSKTE
jgi:hypothetical protein